MGLILYFGTCIDVDLEEMLKRNISLCARVCVCSRLCACLCVWIQIQQLGFGLFLLQLLSAADTGGIELCKLVYCRRKQLSSFEGQTCEI